MRLTSALLGLALEAAPDAAAAAATVVDHVGREQRLLPAVYLARGGRLRCAALRGYWQARDGLPGRTGVMGRTYREGTEMVVEDVGASEQYLEANPGVVAEACFPLRAGGLTVGVLNVESREPLRDGDLDYLRECARALAARIEELGGLPSESGMQRLLRHVAHIADLQDAAAVADALLSAALDLVPLGSVLLARTTGAGGTLRPSVAAGPLAGVLRAAPLESIGEWVEDGISLFTV
ncbi:MAG TPA: GAF domain-containing protein, partial [Solirubrobacteraceae bacterium]